MERLSPERPKCGVLCAMATRNKATRTPAGPPPPPTRGVRPPRRPPRGPRPRTGSGCNEPAGGAESTTCADEGARPTQQLGRRPNTALSPSSHCQRLKCAFINLLRSCVGVATTPQTPPPKKGHLRRARQKRFRFDCVCLGRRW
eukprot:6827732-Alexandrium_andersonii.AAC.2